MELRGRFPVKPEARHDLFCLVAMVIARAKASARSQDVQFGPYVIEGHSVASIIDFIKKDGYDPLVIGFMGQSALYNRVIGSTTDRLVEYAPCKVLVVK